MPAPLPMVQDLDTREIEHAILALRCGLPLPTGFAWLLAHALERRIADGSAIDSAFGLPAPRSRAAAQRIWRNASLIVLRKNHYGSLTPCAAARSIAAAGRSYAQGLYHLNRGDAHVMRDLKEPARTYHAILERGITIPSRRTLAKIFGDADQCKKS